MEESPDRRWIVLAVFGLIAVGVVAAILIGRSGGDGDSKSAGAEGCKQVPEPKPKQVSFEKPKQTVKKGEVVSARIETSCGDFTIALDSERAPKTVNSFVFLSEEGFYDGLPFHRIVPEFVIQGGDPLGDGTGGPGYSVDEKPPANLSYTKGVVAMAKIRRRAARALGEPVLRRDRRRRRSAARICAGRQSQRGHGRRRTDRRTRHPERKTEADGDHRTRVDRAAVGARR